MAISAPVRAADTDPAHLPDRASLIRETLGLERDLVLIRERLTEAERNGLVLYLDLDKLSGSRIDALTVDIGDQVVVEKKIGPEALAILSRGGMIKLRALVLAPGRHELKVAVSSGGRAYTKTVGLEKGEGRDNFKITITRFLQKNTPEITFAHESWSVAP